MQLTRLIKVPSELPKQEEKVETVGAFLLLYFKSTHALKKVNKSIIFCSYTKETLPGGGGGGCPMSPI